jgi:hypothetical protein
MLHRNHHLWSLPSRFPIPCPFTPNLCPSSYMGGCKVRLFRSMAYRKWTFHQISIPMGPKQGPLPSIQIFIFNMPLSHPRFSWDQIITKISSMVVLFPRFGEPLACFRYICADNRHIATHFWSNHYRKGGYTRGGLEWEEWSPTFKEWIVPSSNASSARCFDDLGIRVG